MNLHKIVKFIPQIFFINKTKDQTNNSENKSITINNENTPTTTTPQYLKISTLDFSPISEQIIYIESSYNNEINSQIRNNYDELLNLSTSKNLDFFYLPIKKEQIKSKEFLSYYYPGVSIDNEIQFDSGKFNYDIILSKIKSEKSEFCGFIRYLRTVEEFLIFSYFELNSNNLLDQFKEYVSKISLNTVFYQLSSPESDDDKADFNFNLYALFLIDEIKDRLEKLRMIGMGQSMIESLLLEKPKLSRLVISKDYKILLTDYDIEIEMHPLPKAVYFLFLKHPEGIIFKNLSDYRHELINIYKKITRTDDLSKIVFSINDITDPTKNSINEKCSRIKEAFVKKIDGSIAINYAVQGDRGEPKRILLEDGLIEIQANI